MFANRHVENIDVVRPDNIPMIAFVLQVEM